MFHKLLAYPRLRIAGLKEARGLLGQNKDIMLKRRWVQSNPTISLASHGIIWKGQFFDKPVQQLSLSQQQMLLNILWLNARQFCKVRKVYKNNFAVTSTAVKLLFQLTRKLCGLLRSWWSWRRCRRKRWWARSRDLDRSSWHPSTSKNTFSFSHLHLKRNILNDFK